MRKLLGILIVLLAIAGLAQAAPPFLGTFAEDAEVVFYWNTFDDNGASVTRATDGTVKVIRDDQTDATGTSVTDTEDSLDTGIHLCKVDTSDSANFAVGYTYFVWIDGAVIDGDTVNAVIAVFSIEDRFVNVTQIESADATDAIRDSVVDDATRIDATDLNASVASTGVVIADAYITAAKLATNCIGADEVADGAIDAGAIATDAIDADAIAANAITDAKIANDVQVDVVTIETADATDAINAACDASVETYKLDHLVAVADGDDPVNDSIVAKLAASDGDWSGFSSADDALEAIRDAIGASADSMLLQSGTVTVTDQTHFTLSAGSADDDAYTNMIMVFTDQVTAEQKSVRTVTAYTGATKAITIDSAPDFTIVNSDLFKVVTVAPGSTPPTPEAIADAVWDEASTGHTDAGKAGQQLWTDIDAILTDTDAYDSDGEYAAAIWNAATATYGSAGSYGLLIETNLDATVSSRGTSTLTEDSNIGIDLNDVAGTLDAGEIGASALDGKGDWSTHDAAAVKTAVEADGSKLDTLYDDWVDAGRLDAILDTIAVDVAGLDGDAMRGTDNAALAATALSNATWTDARAAVLSDWIDAGRLDLLLDAIKAVGDKLDTALELDGAVYRFTENALEQAPAAEGALDWTTAEKKQFRKALGLSGDLSDTSGAGILDKVLKIVQAGP